MCSSPRRRRSTSCSPMSVRGSRNSVVIIRLRGLSDPGATFMQMMERYARKLDDASCRLVITYADEKVRSQLEAAGAVRVMGADALYESDEWLGATIRRAVDDAEDWVANASEGPDG